MVVNEDQLEAEEQEKLRQEALEREEQAALAKQLADQEVKLQRRGILTAFQRPPAVLAKLSGVLPFRKAPSKQQ